MAHSGRPAQGPPLDDPPIGLGTRLVGLIHPKPESWRDGRKSLPQLS
jgi:hypothetical protein